MKLLKCAIKKIIITIIIISTIISFLATPSSYAKLDLKDGDFYYSGTTRGTYLPSTNIFSWLLDNIGQIADWLLGILTMIVRMPFVGWAALAEKLLTWALESTTGVKADGSLVGNSNDLTNLSDSSNNVTVEAIVFNRLPALSIDFFDLKFDPTYTGTGQKLMCEKCEKTTDENGIPVYIEKPVEECFGLTTKEELEEFQEKCQEEYETTGKVNFTCGCDCDSCDNCEIFIHQLSVKEPMIIRIRKLIATWYGIIRLLAMAAMLVVLIAIGIKMAISTIASDKAVYKRMLVDWVVGLIMLFTLHYFMLFVIYMNGMIVDVIEKSAASITSVSAPQFSEEDSEMTNSDIELKLYEDVRTRAYDAKLINGTIGMVMYLSLVFMAFKYTIIYLKRLLTILVLTLMAPGVGVAYALQKVLSGKSQALKNWMTEYTMNVIIQIVHALIYAIFVSQALSLALKSISGMIVAVLIMNYSTKADKLFKKIFKFEGNLLGQTENAVESLKERVNTAKKVAITGKMLTQTPYTKAGKLLVKGAASAAVVAGSKLGGAFLTKIGTGERAEEKFNEEVDQRLEETAPQLNPGEKEPLGAYFDRVQEAKQHVAEKKPRKYGKVYLADQGKQQVENRLEKAREELKKNPNDESKIKEFVDAVNDKDTYDNTTKLTTGKIAIAHASRLFSVENHFRVRGTNGLNIPTEDGTKPKIGNRVAAIHNGMFGTLKWDKNAWKFVRQKDSVADEWRPSNLLGFTDADKKKFKEQVFTPAMQTFAGMGSLFLGMGTIMTNPKAGMALLGTGVALTSKHLKKPSGMNSYKGSYTFARFGVPTINNIKNSAIAQSRRERRGLIADQLQQRRPSFVENLKNNKLKAVTLGAVGLISPTALLAGLGAKAVINGVRHPGKTVGRFKDVTVNVLTGVAKSPKTVIGKVIERTAFADNIEEIQKHTLAQQKKQEKAFVEETRLLMAAQLTAETNMLYKQVEEKMFLEELGKLGYSYDPVTKKMSRTGFVSEENVEKPTVSNMLEILAASESDTEKLTKISEILVLSADADMKTNQEPNIINLLMNSEGLNSSYGRMDNIASILAINTDENLLEDPMAKMLCVAKMNSVFNNDKDAIEKLTNIIGEIDNLEEGSPLKNIANIIQDNSNNISEEEKMQKIMDILNDNMEVDVIEKIDTILTMNYMLNPEISAPNDPMKEIGSILLENAKNNSVEDSIVKIQEILAEVRDPEEGSPLKEISDIMKNMPTDKEADNKVFEESLEKITDIFVTTSEAEEDPLKKMTALLMMIPETETEPEKVTEVGKETIEKLQDILFTTIGEIEEDSPLKHIEEILEDISEKESNNEQVDYGDKLNQITDIIITEKEDKPLIDVEMVTQEDKVKIITEILKEVYEETLENNDVYKTDNNTSRDDNKEPSLAEILAPIVVALESSSNNKDDNNSARRDEDSKSEIKEDELEVTVANQKITEADVRLVNEEIEKVLTMLASGKELDMSSKATIDKAAKMLSDRLAVENLIGNQQNAEVLFKAGEEGLKKAIKKKADKINEKTKEANEVLEQMLPKEEAQAIVEVYTEIVQEKTANNEDITTIKPEEIIERLHTDNDRKSAKDGGQKVSEKDGSSKAKERDGSSRVSEDDGSSAVDTSDGSAEVSASKPKTLEDMLQPLVESLEEKEAVSRFIDVVIPKQEKEEKPKEKPVSAKEAKKAIDEAESKVEKRKNKIQQVLEMSFVDIDDTVSSKGREEQSKDAEKSVLSASEVAVQILEQTGSQVYGTGDKKVKLEKQDADVATELFSKYLEIKRVNQIAIEETNHVKPDKNNFKTYTKNRSEMAVEEINYSRAKMERLKLENMEQSNPSTQNNLATKQEISKMKVKEQNARVRADYRRERLEQSGPVLNLETLLKQNGSKKSSQTKKRK